MSEIRLVVFDVGNVILRATHQITMAMLWELGVRPDFASRFFQNSGHTKFARGEISEEQFAEKLNALLRMHFSPSLLKLLFTHHLYGVDEGVGEILERLHERSVPLAFATNTNVWQTEREQELINLQGRYGPIARSHELHLLKDDEGAWPIYLDALGAVLSPEHILLVDDSRKNCVTAEAVGLKTHQFDPTDYGTEHAKLRSALQALGFSI